MSEDSEKGDNAFTGKIRRVTIEIGLIGAAKAAVAAANVEVTHKKAVSG